MTITYDDEEIITHYDPKPIPMRNCDWSAVRDSYEPGWPIGFGTTEVEAIANLLMEEELHST